MIEFNDVKQKELLLHYANEFNDSECINIIESGVNSASEVEQLAKLYWAIVDASVSEDIEYLLEKTYTTLHIHCGNRGFSEVWDNCIP
ncbi:hypothetical protein R50073_11530 [Maricurvus nonylphenolicus]|uniref:hypothetical protein n=1 Tax=Maricurvus nonylphenolicus TaxID=1008307 RepID=UPI0036F243D3